MSLRELRESRKSVRDAVLPHETSLWWFKHPTQPWFIRDASDHGRASADPVRHLTSTATCLESLHEIRSGPSQEISNLTKAFAIAALRAPPSKWESEGAARVYCAVRTLGPILALVDTDPLKRFQGRIADLINFAWARVDPAQPTQQAVAEAPQDSEKPRERQGYPPNAFHTYWAIRLLEEYGRHPALRSRAVTSDAKRPVAELWARHTLAAQTALIEAEADRVDAHQLAWSLSTEFLHSPTVPVTASTPRLDLYRSALASFFRQQQPSGGWPLYEPLFHYPAAGNAYCYTFETLGFLLRPALHARGGRVLRDLLRPYAASLVAAWHYAMRTRIELDAGAVGWCSGHHPHRSAAEAWATASVFSFMQHLRCLLGYWTAEEAATSLGARRARWSDPGEAEDKLQTRGRSWTDPGGWPVGRRLASLFLHPVRAGTRSTERLDPDEPLVVEGQARSAILFGPPGTGKTTLVEALAGAIGWRFVEVHASDFLSAGMDRVPATADEQFLKLMELDHCVILFDEIDELIRRRDDESDPFGRFLTTSMLPKLAKLWEQGRVLFFVATNDLDAADPAIKRSQRFDAAVFAAPPAFHVKRKLLSQALRQAGKTVPAALKYQAVETALSGSMAESDALGVFALLRYDQISELANRAREEAGDGPVSAAALRAALDRMGRALESTEWAHPTMEPYELYRHHRANERYDNRMVQLIATDEPYEDLPESLAALAAPADRGHYLEVVGPLERDITTTADGKWRLDLGSRRLVDNWILSFTTDARPRRSPLARSRSSRKDVRGENDPS